MPCAIRQTQLSHATPIARQVTPCLCKDAKSKQAAAAIASSMSEDDQAKNGGQHRRV